ncbi:MAG TPA: hypothetical protein VJJ52_02865 [Candidatus Nanoarchaeia archaeon]|nr:hypothetical protein [Candidatus Nanoarchaeia archaeon]
MEFKKYSGRFFNHVLSAPFVYILIFPLVALDVFIEIYMHICFRLYGIELIRRKNYIRIDRHKLDYLNLVEKLNCAYCGYANGLLNYAVAIAGATEKYWCGIKHKKYNGFKEPKHHKNFLNYGDRKSFKRKFG